MTRGEDGVVAKTLPPHNEGELLQAANAVGEFHGLQSLESIKLHSTCLVYIRYVRSNRIPTRLG